MRAHRKRPSPVFKRATWVSKKVCDPGQPSSSWGFAYQEVCRKRRWGVSELTERHSQNWWRTSRNGISRESWGLMMDLADDAWSAVWRLCCLPKIRWELPFWRDCLPEPD